MGTISTKDNNADVLSWRSSNDTNLLVQVEYDFQFKPNGSIKLLSVFKYGRKSSKNRFKLEKEISQNSLSDKQELMELEKSLPLEFKIDIQKYIKVII